MHSTMPRGRKLFIVMAAASIASTIGGLPFNALPVMLASLADSFGLPPQTMGLIGSTCFAGYLVGTLGAPIWMNRLDWRVLTIISAAGTALAFAASARVHHVQFLYVTWAAIGFFASTMTCLGMRVLSDLPNKERAYGVRQGTELAITAVVLFALPPLVIAFWKYPGAALALAAVVALLGVSAFWVPRHALATPVATQARGPLPLASVLTLGVFFCFLVGNIGLWAFLARLGTSLSIAPTETGLVFAVLKLLGGIAAFTVAIVGSHLGERLPHVLVLGGLGLGLALLAVAGGFLPYALGAWIWEFSFTCGCVFQTAVIARSDPSGRAIVLVPAAFALGSMVGPGLAGKLLAGGNFEPLLILALASSVVPVLVYSLRRSGRVPGQPKPSVNLSGS